MKRLLFTFSILLLCAPFAVAQKVEVQEVTLDNGLRLLMVPRKGDPNIAAGWIARVGSINERPGITGLSHLFEHMMFKGTHAIGTRNIQENLKIIAELDRVKAEVDKEQRLLIHRQQLGEIDDANDPKNRSPRHQELLKQLSDLTDRERAVMVKDEFDRIYTTAGGAGMNASTSNDWTVYFINVPANKIELWFWMESDRLLNPVFREFYSERDVVREERRLRTESTPTGKFDEQFESLFWQSSPYGWPVVGWPSDLASITREEALAYFAQNYAPNNLTAVLVGDFDPANATALAKKYFGRLKPSPKPLEPVRTLEMPQLAEQRLTAYAETSPQVRARYHTVPDGHKDEYALSVMSALLNGRTGRLYKSLVLQQGIATAAAGFQNGQKLEGYFQLQGTAKPGNTPEEVEQALYKEIEKLQNEAVPERELQKIKNQLAANNFRQLQSNFGLMVQLLLRESSRTWQSINTDPPLLQAVTAADIQRVAKKYFAKENRNVAIYYTKKSDTPEDPELAALGEQERAQIQRLKSMLPQLKVEQVKQILSSIQQQEASAPPEQKAAFKYAKKLLEERLKQLEGGKQ
ncbi:MAG: pitrilysin family protein [Acidobacteriota bacterium]